MSDADSAGSRDRASKASRSTGGQVARVRRQLEAAHALPSPPARATVSAPQVPAAKSAPNSAGRKRKSRQQPAATATAAPDTSGSAPAAPPPKPSFADVVAGRATPEQTISVLVSKIQELTVEVGKVRAFSEKVHDQLQEERQSYTGRLEHLHRHSKRNNLVVFGVPESMVLNTPAALAHHVQGLFFQTGPDSELTLVRSAYRLGRWKQDQSKPRVILVELLSVAAKHTAFQSSSRLRGMKIRLDEDLTPQQMKQRRGLSPDFQLLKARGYKPFFRGPTLKYRDGALIRKCARGEANKVVAAAVQAARAAVPTPPRHQQTQGPRRVAVAMDPSVMLHQHGIIGLDSDLDSVIAQAAQAAAADAEGMMRACDDGVAG